MKTYSKLALVVALLGGLVNAAPAATITQIAGNATFTLGDAPPVSVMTFGQTGSGGTNLTGDPSKDGFLNSSLGAGYLVIDKNDDTTTGVSVNFLNNSGLNNKTTSGTWTIGALPGYTSFALGLKAATGWVVFDLGGSTTGTWSIDKNLSHAVLYAKQTTVPLPAAVWLFGSALLGMVGIGYRRKTQNT